MDDEGATTSAAPPHSFSPTGFAVRHTAGPLGAGVRDAADQGPQQSTTDEKFEKKGELLKPGSLWVYPAKHAHYAWTGNEEGILQLQLVGPGGIDYVNPAGLAPGRALFTLLENDPKRRRPDISRAQQLLN